MRTIAFSLLLLIFISCDDFGEPKARRLTKIESISYSGFVLHTEFGYDMQGRITTITQYIDDEDPVDAVTVTYNGNEATLISYPTFDPLYDQTKKVVLTLNGNGLTQKRIEHTTRVNSAIHTRPVQGFIYDTLHYEYDASGFLTKTTGSRYDSTSLLNPSANTVRRVTTNGNYNVEAGNISTSDEFVVYTVERREGNISTLSGGTSERHWEFGYTKSYPNKTDFSNIAILNEYKQDHEAYLNINYNHMQDQVMRSTIDRDLDGEVFFSISNTYLMERTYHADGLLSTVKIPPGVQYTEVRYIYR